MNDPVLQNDFMKGEADTALEGFYTGSLAKLFPVSIGEIMGGLLLNIWLPWQGKYFYQQEGLGDNILSPSLEFIIRFLFRDFDSQRPPDKKFHAFPFRTYVMPGLMDQINVLQLNYDLPQNPPAVRKVIDELVKVGEHSYLGKAYIVENNNPRLVSYFRLKK